MDFALNRGSRVLGAKAPFLFFVQILLQYACCHCVLCNIIKKKCIKNPGISCKIKIKLQFYLIISFHTPCESKQRRRVK